MAMPAITGFEPHPENPEWIRLNFADGSQSPFAQDPDGSFRKQATEVAQKLSPPSPLAGNPLAMPLPGAAPASVAPAPGLPLAGNPLAMPTPGAAPPEPIQGAPESIAREGLNPALIAPSTPQILSPGAVGADQQRALNQQEAGHQQNLSAGLSQQRVQEQRTALARSDAEQAQGAQGYRIVQGAPMGGGVSSSHTTQTGGLAPEDRKRVDAANTEAVNAQFEADQSALRARTEQVNAEWMRLTDQEKSKLAEEAMRKGQEADLTAKVDNQTKKLEELTARPIDPSKAFQGDAGWYAFMAGFGDSIQNFGAALAGRGPVANPGATIDRMIERSVQQQTQQQEQEFKAGRLTADQLNAERDYVRAQLATVGKQLADTQLGKARTEDENLGLRAMSDKFEADRKAAIARNAAATARTQQVNDTTQRTPGAGGGPSLFLGEKADWEAVGKHGEKTTAYDTIQRGIMRGEKANGWTWDEKANNGAGGYIGQDGKPITEDTADPSGISIGGHRFTLGQENARELQGAAYDMAVGSTKLKDPNSVARESEVQGEIEAMGMNTDAGILRSMTRMRRDMRGARANVDSQFSPGVVNAARYNRAAADEFRSNQPGLPRSRAATAGDLR